MDVSNSDADFDSYWEEEARNPNRNRIRIGRQYQATVPPLLKQGESDGRKLEELETLKWNPDNELTDQQLEQYLSVAKAVSLFTAAIDNNYSQSPTTVSTENSHNLETNETNTNSEENTNCDKSEDKSKETNSSSTSSVVKDHRIQSALKGLSEFVSSHHPIHRDIGCRVPSLPEQTSNCAESESTNSLTTLLSAEWNPNETKLFSEALEVCGKNFGAIKKEFLPWKSVKSIIEHYYLGIDRESAHSVLKTGNETNVNQSETALNTKRDSNTSSSVLDVSSVSKFMTTSAESKPELNDTQRTQSLQKCFEDNTECDLKKNCDNDSTTRMCGVSGQEVKPLKAKPILPTAIQESNNNISTVGSLKFYLDGQLVLKLNAQQELLGQRCQWVESADTSKRPRPLHKTGKRLLMERQDSELQNNSNNHKSVNSDDLDDVSNESSDDDSMESNESALVPSPSALVAKKAKVKLENNSYKSLSSPTSLPSKEQKMDVLNASNPSARNVKIEASNVVKREPLSPNTLANEEEFRKRCSTEPTNDKKNGQNCLENKWYQTIVERSSLQPPKAHSSSSSGQSHRHSRYDSVQTSVQSSSSSSSSSSTSSSSSSSYTVPVPASVPSNAIPVDLTRKSTNYSPFDTKSSPAGSSAQTFSGYSERDKNYKVFESPSPPRMHPSLQPSLQPSFQPPFVFPYPAPYSPVSPTQSQHKPKKELKSSSNLCQKGSDGRPLVKSSPPSSPSSIPSSTPPLPPQYAWLQNSLVSYLPIYEQYYRYYYGYGMPVPHHSTGERSPSSHTSQESEANSKERAKCLTDALLVDGDRDANCGS